ncbi:MAG: gliding motility-associated ABC transporter ATP-binding subunit GldA [Chitinophagaceae bacterium]|nr:MAG: gliding motility-associated ABC transporter ATP-binding subunit GldA [Chitinophagaceae bacterium]
MSIRVENLLKLYGEQKAVNNISFKINRGEIVGFLGPNGAGKSTTMKMITGYLAPDGGSIDVCGIDAVKNSLAAKKKIGYLPEANPLYYDMYIREYLGFISNLHHLQGKKEKIEQVIKKVGLTPEAHKKIGQLSKGYKQRVGLAAAMLHDPEVLILDEPTSGLDPNQIMEIRAVIRELAENKTILFSSHIMQEVESLCDRVIIINKGNIVADDSLNSLKRLSEDKTQIVMVEFSEPVNSALLKAMDKAEQVEKTGNATYAIRTADGENIRRQLLQLSVNHQWNILSLQTREQNLESIFKDLTTK